jgi:membrane associated rhomboid family serine protease
MGRYSPGSIAYSFGPGPLSPAVKWLIWANIAVFVVSYLVQGFTYSLGLRPDAVLHHYALWQPLTYMFLHAGVWHILFNMLALWMFGVELERLWGTPFFLKFYFVTGVGAALMTLLLSLVPFGLVDPASTTVGASGAIYGLLLAYALYFPRRPIYVYMLFPVPAKYFVMIFAGIALLLSISGTSGGIANVAHLGGMVFGYAYLKYGHSRRPLAEMKYRYFKWKMNRHRRRFDVYSGGRANDWDRRIH